MYFKSALRFETLRQHLRGPTGDYRFSIRAARGSPSANRTYCTKTESRDPSEGSGPFEFGNCPCDSGKRKDFQAAIAILRERRSLREIAVTYPLVYAQYYNGLQRLLEATATPRTTPPIVHWYYGPSGAGKSRTALERGLQLCGAINAEHPTPDVLPYYKESDHKWWGGYVGQRVVILDDFRPTVLSYDYLLRLLDRYPVQVEGKGNQIQFNSEHIFITSAQSPMEYYGGLVGRNALIQLIRRLGEIRKFDYLPGHEPEDVQRALRLIEEYEAETGARIPEVARAAQSAIQDIQEGVTAMTFNL